MALQATRSATGLIYRSDFSSLAGWAATDGVFAADTTRPTFASYALPAPVLSPAAIGSSDGSGLREANIQIDAAGRWHMFYDSGDGTTGALGKWRVKRAFSDDKGLTWTKAGDVTFTGVPAQFSTVTSQTHIIQFGGFFYAYCMSPTSYSATGIPGGNYHTVVCKASVIEGPYAYVGDNLPQGGAGSFDEQACQIASVVNEGGNYTAYYCARTASTAGAAWTTGRATATDPSGLWTKDGNGGATVTSAINNATNARMENQHVWYSAALGKWVMLANSVNSASTFTDGNDIVYANGTNLFKAIPATGSTTTQRFADTFVRAAGAVGNGWTVTTVNGFPTVNGAELDLGNTVGASRIHRLDHSYADVLLQADVKASAGNSVGFLLRVVDNLNFLNVDIIPATNVTGVTLGRAVIVKSVGGTETNLGIITFTGAGWPADIYANLKVQLVGNTYSVWVNDVLQGTLTDTASGGNTAYTAPGGVGFRNGNGGTGARLVKNFVYSSISPGATPPQPYRTRVQRLVASDSLLAVGMAAPLRDAGGNTIVDSAGRVAIVYDADPPANFNGSANTGFHLGRRIRPAILEPIPSALRVLGANQGGGYLARTISATDFIARFTVQFQSADGQVNFVYRMSDATEATNTCYLIDFNNVTNAIDLYRKSGATFTRIAQSLRATNLPAPPDSSNAYLERVKVVVTGNRHQIFLDGTAQIDFTDATPLTAGSLIGFRNGSSASNFRITDFAVRKAETVVFSGLPASATVALRAGGYPMVSGVADGAGNLTLTSAHYPATDIQINAETITPATGVWGGDAFSVTSVDGNTISLTLRSAAGVLRANLTGLSWAFFDQNKPNLFAAPTAKGSGATTDASGVLAINVTGTALGVGGVGWLVISDSDGTVIFNSKAFSAPVAVA